jgi:hypothetical protein
LLTRALRGRHSLGSIIVTIAVVVRIFVCRTKTRTTEGLFQSISADRQFQDFFTAITKEGGLEEPVTALKPYQPVKLARSL